MNIPKGQCSYCNESFLNCKCEQFHPNVKEDFILDNKELIALQEYFLKRAGYISPEFDLVVLDISNRIDLYFKG